MSRVITSRLSAQPQSPTTIDWGNPITKGLRFALNGAFPQADAITGQHFTTVVGAGVVIVPGPGGKAMTSGTSTNASRRWTLNAPINAPFTAFITLRDIGSDRGTLYRNPIVFETSADAFTGGFNIESTNLPRYSARDTANVGVSQYTTGFATNTPATEIITMAGTVAANGEVYFFYNGQRQVQTDSNLAGSPRPIEKVGVCGDGLSGAIGESFHGDLYNVYIWDRVLTNREIAELHRHQGWNIWKVPFRTGWELVGPSATFDFSGSVAKQPQYPTELNRKVARANSVLGTFSATSPRADALNQRVIVHPPLTKTVTNQGILLSGFNNHGFAWIPNHKYINHLRGFSVAFTIRAGLNGGNPATWIAQGGRQIGWAIGDSYDSQAIVWRGGTDSSFLTPYFGSGSIFAEAVGSRKTLIPGGVYRVVVTTKQNPSGIYSTGTAYVNGIKQRGVENALPVATVAAISPVTNPGLTIGCEADIREDAFAATQNPLSGTWTTGLANGMQSAGSGAFGSTGGGAFNCSYLSIATFTADPDQYSEVTFGAIVNSDNAGPVVRWLNTGGGVGYVATYFQSTNTISLERWSAGANAATLATISSVTLNTTDTLGLGIVDTVLTVYKNRQSIGSATNGTVTTGQPGIFVQAGGSNGTIIKSWFSMSFQNKLNGLTAIGNVIIYDRVLTDSEITQDYLDPWTILKPAYTHKYVSVSTSPPSSSSVSSLIWFT